MMREPRDHRYRAERALTTAAKASTTNESNARVAGMTAITYALLDIADAIRQTSGDRAGHR